MLVSSSTELPVIDMVLHTFITGQLITASGPVEQSRALQLAFCLQLQFPIFTQPANAKGVIEFYGT
jgi:hypothetical protein